MPVVNITASIVSINICNAEVNANSNENSSMH